MDFVRNSTQSAAGIILPLARQAAIVDGKSHHDSRVAALWKVFQDIPFYTVYQVLKGRPQYLSSFLGPCGVREYFHRRVFISPFLTEEIETGHAILHAVIGDEKNFERGAYIELAVPCTHLRRLRTYLIIQENVTRVFDHILPAA